MPRTVLVLVFALLSGISAQLQCTPTANFSSLGSFDVPSPGFLTIAPGADGKTALFISQFFVNPFKKGSVSVVNDLQNSWPNPSAFKPVELFEYLWPNLVAPVPEAIFGRKNLFTVAGGFLVPGKNTGAVSIFDMSTSPPTIHKISTDLTGHFFHEATWWDVDQDGHLDLAAARASMPVVGPSTGNLVWYRNPGTLDGPWEEHQLLTGPDVFFRVASFNGDGRLYIVAAQFFSAKLALYVCERSGFCNASDAWTEIVIDTTIGPLFDVRIVDLNNDGRPELLVTNHIDNATISGVFAYEVPAQITPSAKWVRHDLAVGFKVLVPGPNQASPGGAVTFQPRTPWSGRPWIAVSGDGAAQAYILRPLSENPRDWSYGCSLLVATEHHGTVGGIAVADVNGDGHADIFVPDYDHSVIDVFTFKS